MIKIKSTAAPPPGGDPREFVMSDGTVDRMGDVIEQDGWELANFRRNPIALFGHSPGFPIGKWHDVQVRDGQLTGRLELIPPASERMRELHAAVDAGVLRAVSVGFHPIKAEPLDPDDPWFGPQRFVKSELVECSLVAVPANANALQVAKAAGISRETQSLIFGEVAVWDQAARRGFNGGIAEHDSSIRKHKAMNLSDRIVAAQTNVNALRDALKQHYTDVGDVLDEPAIAKADELNAQIDAELRRIDTMQKSEAAVGAAATDTGVGAPGVAVARVPAPFLPAAPTPPRPFAMPKKEEKPGEILMRAIIAKLFVEKAGRPAEAFLAENGWSEDTRVRACFDWVQRAATAPAFTNVPTWAQELVRTQFADLVAALLIASIYQPLAALGVRYTLGRYGTISIPVEGTTPTVAGSFVAEGAPIPVRQAAFSTIAMGLKKMAVISSFSRELFESSVPNIDTQLRDMMGRHTSAALDTVLIDNIAATTIRPAGLRAGVSGLTPTTGGGFTALVADLKQMLNVLTAANSLRMPVWIMNPQQVLSITLTQSAAGVGVFPFKAEVEQGRLMTYPIISSSTVPVGMVILLDAADFASLAGDDPRFELSDQATLHMEDTAPQPIGTAGTPNVVAAPVRSMFQTDSIALRMILPMNWMMRRTGLVAWITGVTW
jgi:HK97 family phage major capsid protein/HK97 family phage prohead protease